MCGIFRKKGKSVFLYHFFPVFPLPTFLGPGSLGILFDFSVLLLAPLPQAEGGNTALKACEDTR